jgi:hypothetical protein
VPVARVADWIEFDDGMFDAILFTRSLHHIEPLDLAVKRTAQQLTSGGDLIIEDFAYAEIAATSVGWLLGCARSLVSRDMADPERSPFVAELLEAHDPLETWKRYHGTEGHGIHTAEAIGAAVRAHFASVHEESAPYLYRYLCTMLVGPRSAHVAAELLDAEEAMIRRVTSAALGRRWVASGPSAIRESVD